MTSTAAQQGTAPQGRHRGAGGLPRGEAGLLLAASVAFGTLFAFLYMSGLPVVPLALGIVALIVGVACVRLAVRRYEAFLLALIAFRPLVDIFALGGSSLTNPSVALGIVFTGTSLWWLWQQFRAGRWVATSPLVKGLSLLLAAVYLSCIVSVSPVTSISSAVKFTSAVLMFVVLEQGMVSGAIKRAQVLRSFVVCAAIVVTISALQTVTGTGVLDADIGLKRSFLPFVHPNILAKYLVIVGLVGVANVLLRPGPWDRRRMFLLALAPLALSLVGTYARVGWATFAVGVLYLVAVKDRRVVPLIIGVGAAVMVGVPSVWERISSLWEAKSPAPGVPGNSLLWRYEYWQHLLPMARMTPYNGLGYDTIQLIGGQDLLAHNVWVQTYVEMGFFGLFGLISAIVGVALALRGAVKATPKGARGAALHGAIAVAIAMGIMINTENVLAETTTLWYGAVAMITGYCAIRARQIGAPGGPGPDSGGAGSDGPRWDGAPLGAPVTEVIAPAAPASSGGVAARTVGGPLPTHPAGAESSTHGRGVSSLERRSSAAAVQEHLVSRPRRSESVGPRHEPLVGEPGGPTPAEAAEEELRSGDGSSLGRLLAGNMATSVGQIVFSFATTLLTTRLLPADERGQIAAIQGGMLTLTWLSLLGFPQALTYFAAKGKDAARTVVGVGTLSIVPAGLLGILLAQLWIPFGLDSLGEDTRELARWAALLMPCFVAGETVWPLLGGLHLFTVLNVGRLLQNGLYLVGVVTLWAVGALSPAHVLLAQFAAYTIVAGSVLILLARRFGVGLDNGKSLARRAFGYGLRQQGETLPELASARMDGLLVGRYVQESSVAYYNNAVQITSLVITFYGNLAAVIFPMATKSSADGDFSAVERGTRLALYGGVLMALAMGVVAPWLVPAVFGPEYSNAVLPLWLLLPGVVALPTTRALSSGLLAMGMPGRASAAQVAGVVVTVVGLFATLGTFGIVGAAVVSSVAYITTLLVVIWICAHREELSVRSALSLPGFLADMRAVAHYLQQRRRPAAA